MKKYINILLLALMPFILTGCITQQINYQENFVSYELNKNFNRIKDDNVVIVAPPSNIGKRPTGFAGGAVTMHVPNSLNGEVAKDFMEQYFNYVTLSSIDEKGDFLKIHTEILDFTHSLGFQGGLSLDMEIKIDVLFGKKMILSKRYRTVENPVHMTHGLIRGWNPKSFKEEQIHKYILNLYEGQFKPDLLKALADNI